MLEREEERLRRAKNRLDEQEIPEHLIDNAIRTGMEKAKRSKKPGYAWRTAAAAALILLTLFTSSLRVSEAFASYVSSIPGMEKIVELVRQDKGLVSLIENDYAQKVNRSDSNSGIEVTLDSFIADEEQLVLFYTIDSETIPLENVRVDRLRVETKSGEEVPFKGISLPGLGSGKNIYQSDIGLRKPLSEEEYVLTMKLIQGEEPFADEWRIPFSLDQGKVATTKLVNMNSTFEVEEQEIVVKKIEISPTRIGVTLNYPQENSKRIFDIEDLRLVDEKGETWSKISNGLIASGDFNEKTYYLQSNYFEKPNKLYLVFNTIRALDKEKLIVKADPVDLKILQAPDEKLAEVIYEEEFDNQGALLFSWDKNYEQANHMNPIHTYFDKDGIEHNPQLHYYSEGSEGRLPTFGFPYDRNKNPGPITFELQDYPSWIEGKVKIAVPIE